MRNAPSTRTRLSRIAVVAAVFVGSVSIPVLTATAADAAPPPQAPRTSGVVTADTLPTTQINGVAWSQAIVNNTVFVGGSFTTARPAGAAAGTSTSARNNLMSYDITTGAMLTWNPYANAQVNVVALSPDKSRLYIGGDFTSTGGQVRQKIAAYNTATGALISTFAPTLNGRVKAITVTSTAVYVGGVFTQANGVARARLAAFDLTGSLLNWAPTANLGVNALVMSADGSKVIAGGAFQTINGSEAYGMGAIDPSSGALLPWLTTQAVRNAGPDSAILSLRTDGTDIYGTGYHFGGGGNLEGSFRANGTTGQLIWVEDCHGDTYDVFPGAEAVYTVSHSHYCGNVNGFPQTDPWSFSYALAWSKGATGTVSGPDPYGYPEVTGQPAPSMIGWFPRLTSGTYTGQSQAGWTINGNSQYVVIGGEFPTANNKPQQGLVRFAVSPIGPGKIGPEANAALKPTIVSQSSGTARVAFQATWDRDDLNLTYKVFRNGNLTTPVYTTTANSTFWNKPSLGFTDTGLTNGQTYSYRVFAYDALGNSTSTGSSLVTVSNAPASAYVNKIKADGASTLWRLGEASGAVAYDSVGFTDGVVGTAVTRGSTGSVIGETDTASNFDGTGASLVTSPSSSVGTDTFTIQSWIKTTTTSGGKILGFGNVNTGLSSNYDRHLYMTNDGRIVFGVYAGGTRTVSTPPSYNDGNWHQVTASLSDAGIALYVDGKQVGQDASVTTAQPFGGYWRVGGDNLGGWPDQPASNSFTGSIDEVAFYPTALSRQTIDAQWVASGRASSIPTAPADAYGAAVFNDNPQIFWRLGDTGGTAVDSGPNGDFAGTYFNGVTHGAAGAIAGTADTAASFDGNDQFVSSNASFNNPTVYSLEAWFKTTSTSGGKIIGFGNTRAGSSSGYDRHIYVQGDGAVVFGVWTGQTNTVNSATGFNNGQWHHVVGTQGSDGLKLYVDGALVGTNPQTQAQDYTGYWKVGGDNTWSSAPYLAGTIDEVAVYGRVLGQSVVTSHYKLGAATPVNQVPTASFTTSGTGDTVSVDASGSTDSDGTITGYAWDFGDGHTGTGPITSHVYGQAGTYTISLKVTDNGGLSTTTTQSVTVPPPPANQAPTAAFTVAKAGLTVNVDGTGSSDADGTIAGYSWSFGDTPPGADTGATASYVYPAAGTYTITLTVTDNGGLTASTTRTVTVTNPNTLTVFAADTFGRTVNSGLGAADTGGSWTTIGGASLFKVNGSVATVTMNIAGAGPSAFLNTVSAQDVLATVGVAFDGVPPTGGTYTSLAVRRIGTSDYRVTVKFLPTGTAVSLIRMVNNVQTTLATSNISTLRYAVGDVVRIQLKADENAGATALSAKVWKTTAAQPATWQVTASDSLAALQAPGGVGFQAYLSGSATNAPVVATVDNLSVTTIPAP